MTDSAELVTQDEIDAFGADGAVCLRSVIDRSWIAKALAGVEQSLADPSPRSRLWHRDEDGHESRYDSQVWQNIPEFREFIFHSPMAEIAGRLMGATRVNFFFDAMFVRTSGTRFRTPFHQDEPYWSVEGFQTCSVWMPLVPVAKANALECVRGSHLWTERFHQTNFGALTGDDRDQVVFGEDAVPFPDIDGRRDEFDILSWDMEPGDVLCFNGRTIHGGSGQLPPERELRVFNTKWTGDDVVVRFREEGMDPDHREAMISVGLRPGDRLGTDLYPEVWQQSTATIVGARR